MSGRIPAMRDELRIIRQARRNMRRARCDMRLIDNPVIAAREAHLRAILDPDAPTTPSTEGQGA